MPKHPSSFQLGQCANRRVGHNWNDPDNQRWEMTDPVRIGRRNVARVLCVSRCTRCGSERVEPYLLDSRSCLAEKERMYYRHSSDFKRRDRLDVGELNWMRVPQSLRIATIPR